MRLAHLYDAKTTLSAIVLQQDGISGFLERADGGGADGGVKMAVAAALQRLGGMAPKELAAGKLTQKLVQVRAWRGRCAGLRGCHVRRSALRAYTLRTEAQGRCRDGEGAARKPTKQPHRTDLLHTACSF
jgi:hypothetical protein